MTSYIIPFVALLPPCFMKNNKNALHHAEFAANAINELVINRCTTDVFSRRYCCNPLSGVGGSKLRLVLDLSRSVNPFGRKFKFEYESLPTLAVMFRDNFWFFTFDIESGYHHLDINFNCWKYLFLGPSMAWKNISSLEFCHLACHQPRICLQTYLGHLSLDRDRSVFSPFYILMTVFSVAEPYLTRSLRAS